MLCNFFQSLKLIHLKTFFDSNYAKLLEEKIEEKMDNLHEARMELTKMESKIIILAKENEFLWETPRYEKIAYDHLDYTTDQYNQLLEENTLLQNIISSWNSKKSSK